jgi:hypothetical protein
VECDRKYPKGGDTRHLPIDCFCVEFSPQSVRRSWKRDGREHEPNAQGEYKSEGNHRPERDGSSRIGAEKSAPAMRASSAAVGRRSRRIRASSASRGAVLLSWRGRE